jgi:hypothetical protein
MYTQQQDIQVHNNRKQNNRFDNSRQLFDHSRQFQIQMKLKLQRRVAAVESSHRVQEGVDEVISQPTALLWSWAALKDM